MIHKILKLTFSHLREIALAELVKDRLIMIALANDYIDSAFIAYGARDTLLLKKSGDEHHERYGSYVIKSYHKLADIRRNNCSIGVLHGKSSLALIKKHQFMHFDFLLIPAGYELIPLIVGILRYGSRKGLNVIGKTTLTEKNNERIYLVVSIGIKSAENRRQYGPSGLSPEEILRKLDGIDYVCINSVDSILSGNHVNDIDLLVAEKSIPALLNILRSEIGTYPIDIYTENGAGGFTSNGAPYFTPSMAKNMLQDSKIESDFVRVPSVKWHYLSYCYQLLFHKSKYVPPGTEIIQRNTFHKPRYFDKLIELSKSVGTSPPRTFSELEDQLKSETVFPSIDLIGFYSLRNPFLKHRYFDTTKARPGLATFFVRDFGAGLSTVDDVREHLKKYFNILVEGPITDELRPSVMQGVRGGNWTDPNYPDRLAKPVYWFVCWDESPKSPSRRMQKKHPRLDNEHIRIKDLIRREMGTGARKTQPLVHSSDNSLEALDHVDRLKLSDHPKLVCLDIIK